MKRRLATLPLLLLVPLTLGCDPAEADCEPPPSSFRGIWENGTDYQGSTLQGSTMQGERLQGVWSNGNWSNGTTYQGIDLAGLRLASAAGDSTAPAIELRGTELVATVADEALDPVTLVGAAIPARLSDGTTIELSIADTVVDDDLHYYALMLDGANICGPDGRGLFVRGVWHDDGSRHDALDDASTYDVTFSCTDGVIAKCVVWGYRPWEVGANVHQACTRLARADYCGDGIPYTRDGTEIDVYDDLGVQVPTLDRPDFEFEAAWGPDGAICVERPRYHEIVEGEGEILPPCWHAKPTCDSPEAARELGAILFNESVDQVRPLCAAR